MYTCSVVASLLAAPRLTHTSPGAQLFNFGIRINQSPPKVKYTQGQAGGISYQEVVLQTKGMNPEVARMVLKEYRVSCAEIILREDITVDQFIDVLEGNRTYMPVLYVMNKIDQLTIEEVRASIRSGVTFTLR